MSALREFLKQRKFFAVIWDGHTGSSIHLYPMTDLASKKKAEIGGVYGAYCESFYDLTRGLNCVLMVRGDYGFSEDDWMMTIDKVMKGSKE